ncbi:MAG: DNA polymerase bacteriophage-type [Parcubacteria bacterium C7867-006]|nr:MAG: DNA polymerase bacteriophage-type [Parcubacteria bacterium C7867-006]
MSFSLEEKFDKMKNVRDQVLHLKESPLYEYRVQNKYFPVVGEGSLVAHIMFIGEAPGKNEAETARPFCGKSGKVLDEMLESISLNRSDVYITNIVKDRPPENRDPSPEEIKIYAPFLDEQIDIIQPKVIATLGRFSMEYIFNRFNLSDKLGTIGDLHGKEFKIDTYFGSVVIIPLYHPAVTLYNGSNKDTLVQDFQVLKKYIQYL